jgi:hypothetical protein
MSINNLYVYIAIYIINYFIYIDYAFSIGKMIKYVTLNYSHILVVNLYFHLLFQLLLCVIIFVLKKNT